MLFARGDPGSSIYFVTNGRIRLAIATSDGRELSFKVAGPGDLFGEIAGLDGWPRSAETVALTPAIAYSLDGAIFGGFAWAVPQYRTPSSPVCAGGYGM